MNLIIFSIILIFCFEILNFFKTFLLFNKQLKLYKEIFLQIRNENVFFQLSKKILVNSIKLVINLLITVLPILIFFIYLNFVGDSISNFILSFYNISITLIIFLLYLFLRKKIVKRKL